MTILGKTLVISAAAAGILTVYAYRAVPASTLAPLQYFEIVSATIFGWLVFDNFPDAIKWLGILIITGSGLYILWRERRFASKPVSDTSETAGKNCALACSGAAKTAPRSSNCGSKTPPPRWPRPSGCGMK